MRSLLFVPGDSPRKFEKASQGPADALILDLEDAVAPERKQEARGLVAEMLRAPRGRQRFFVRVNALDSGATLDDLAAVVPARPDGIVLPKCTGGADARQLGYWLDAFERAAGLQVGATQILPIAVESAEALFALGSFVGVPRLCGLTWGAEDLAASFGATASRGEGGWHGPFRLARDLCLAAAAAAGVVAVDTVWTDIENLAGLEAEARAARRDGFGAKALIHPKHVEVTNAAFTPSPSEVEWAEKVTALLKDAPAGAARLDGRMVDKAHLRLAERILGSAREA